MKTLLVASALLLTGCDSDSFLNRLQAELDAARIVFTGGSSPLQQHHKDLSSKSSQKGNSASMLAQESKENAEVLQEVFRVVYIRELGNTAEFGSLVDTLNQGASVEGVYNGIVHGSIYRKFETDHPGAKAKALHFFADELARTELQLSTITIFPASAAQPLAVPEQPKGTDAEIDFPGKAEKPPADPLPSSGKPTQEMLEKKYGQDFSGASVYTLKRILADEVLKLMSEKGDDSAVLAKWYGAFVKRMAGYHVDFGLALRNNPDEQFHEGWAMSVSGDRLRWEVLNRIHRVLNQAEYP